jgi:hypothetical protein
VALAEVGDGAEVRPVQPGHRHHVDPFLERHGQADEKSTGRGYSRRAGAPPSFRDGRAGNLAPRCRCRGWRRGRELPAPCRARNAPYARAARTHAATAAEASPDRHPTSETPWP